MILLSIWTYRRLIRRIFWVLIVLVCELNVAAAQTSSGVELNGLLLQAAQAKKGHYEVKTKYLTANGAPSYVNRLILEDSPYLLQHAHNPVHWYAWGDVALELAKQQHKPIFLSIGYSTCFWCHVMAEESFDNMEIAALLNKHFISIKVDRESRPDIDAYYGAAVESITGSAGWPMSAFLLPDGSPFLGGGYFTPEKFKNLLLRVVPLWERNPKLLEQQAHQVKERIAPKLAQQDNIKLIEQADLDKALALVLSQYDSLSGGFGYQAKFPHESWLLFLLEAYSRTEEPRLMQVLEHTLQSMVKGGIYDHLGGGFHRYTTDPQWLMPHFEKMLYNQAQLSHVFLLAYQLTGNAFYARVAQETLDYVLTDLAYVVGGYYSATDALSGGEEGGYFLWSKTQFEQAVPKKLNGLAMDLFAITEQGDLEGKNVLHLPFKLTEYATLKQLDFKKLQRDFESIKGALRGARKQRPQPFQDTKIITAWNAMMIESLVLASELLNDERYLQQAINTAEFIWWNQYIKDKHLWRVYWQGHSSVAGQQEDYAYFASCLLKLYDATADKLWLARAKQITDDMIGLFWDKDGGSFFTHVASADKASIKFKLDKDNEISAANAIALTVLSRLDRRLGSGGYGTKAAQLSNAFATSLESSTLSYIGFLLAANEFLLGEQGHIQYAAKGNVRVQAQYNLTNKGGQLVIDITMQPGWHINAKKPLQNYLIPTSIKVTDRNINVRDIKYPEPIVKKLTFNAEVLALYEHNAKIEVLFEMLNSSNFMRVNMELQACNDKSCLPPDTVFLTVPINMPLLTEKINGHIN